MQSKLITALGAALTVGIVAACSATQGNATSEAVMTEKKDAPRTSASYTLRQGESATLAPGTTLKLERVNDSRCRPGAVCVWAGYISYTFNLTNAAGSREFVLAENMPNAGPSVTQDGLTFALEDHEPPAPTALHAPLPDYRVNVRVTISPSN
jgi:hypothetical protein